MLEIANCNKKTSKNVRIVKDIENVKIGGNNDRKQKLCCECQIFKKE